MVDVELFERHLAAALRSEADVDAARSDAAAIARTAITSNRRRPLRSRPGTVWTMGHPMAGVAYLLIILAVLVALIAGALAVGELRRQTARLSAWTPSRPLLEARGSDTATLLDDGRVLVVGGIGGPNDVPLASAELYDPRTATWAAAGRMTTPRAGHATTLLPDGKVLVTGGDGGNGPLGSAEVFDPGTGSWASVGAMMSPRAGHAAALLPGGSVLVAGGDSGSGSMLATAELFDPASGTWAATGSMVVQRGHLGPVATVLHDGRALVVGGYSGGGSTIPPTAELYDPASGSWTATGDLVHARGAGITVTLLPTGEVLVTGGDTDCCGFLHEAELFDPVTGSWQATGDMAGWRQGHTAAVVQGGRVLVAGGDDPTDIPQITAETYEPVSRSWAQTASPTVRRESGTATLLPHGRVLVAGGNDGSGPLAETELYDPGTAN
jgi:N-acetylneuraminic acid mutarotase